MAIGYDTEEVEESTHIYVDDFLVKDFVITLLNGDKIIGSEYLKACHNKYGHCYVDLETYDEICHCDVPAEGKHPCPGHTISHDTPYFLMSVAKEVKHAPQWFCPERKLIMKHNVAMIEIIHTEEAEQEIKQDLERLT